MPQIQTNHQPVTQITIVESEPGKQDEALSLMTERARFMAQQPGFISISLHRSLDGRRIVNYVRGKIAISCGPPINRRNSGRSGAGLTRWPTTSIRTSMS